ncbi:MAG: HD domain-containing protein [Verrucomicrobia bacterium]|nr:HD domain-containing protein [Verrucomicrobiota bacterium]
MTTATPHPGLPLALPPRLAAILAHTPELQRAYLVGGCVRDALLGLPVKDFDIEVFGVGYDALAKALQRWGRTDFVGRSFGVIKLTVARNTTYDFSIPRRDSKTGSGHKGFAITLDPAITPREAAARRDFTINALLYDPRRGELLDFFGGRDDLRAGVLRHTSQAFTEDPLRVLRGMQFAGRFDLRLAPETAGLCRRIKDGFRELAVERVREEWFKWAARSRVPSAGLRVLVETGWSDHFPELAALVGTPQDPEWHPEGDVFTHTGHALDALVTLPGWLAADEESRVVYSLAVLAHDFGKPATTQTALREGRERIVSPGHEEAGRLLTEQFLDRINAPLASRERVLPLVANHLVHLQPATARSVRRLAKRLAPETIQGLALVITADSFGRPPRPRVPPEGLRSLLQVAEALELEAAAPKPILKGRHLLPLGLSAGPDLGRLLDAAFEAQLDGAFSDLPGALAWVAEQSAIELGADVRERARKGAMPPAPE